mmetsp:Transcript_71958/g.139048  ORF Transcript_71958/g.139048 Transcript_71958/m.139048 type:complete len:229 (+) Transcript_71958:327-1013(+)
MPASRWGGCKASAAFATLVGQLSLGSLYQPAQVWATSLEGKTSGSILGNSAPSAPAAVDHLWPMLPHPQRGAAQQETPSAISSYASGKGLEESTSGSGMTWKSISGLADVYYHPYLRFRWHLSMRQNCECHPPQASCASASLVLAIWAAMGRSHCDKSFLRPRDLRPPQIVAKHAAQDHRPRPLVSHLVRRKQASVASWGTNAFQNRMERPQGPLKHCSSVGHQLWHP